MNLYQATNTSYKQLTDDGQFLIRPATSTENMLASELVKVAAEADDPRHNINHSTGVVLLDTLTNKSVLLNSQYKINEPKGSEDYIDRPFYADKLKEMRLESGTLDTSYHAFALTDQGIKLDHENAALKSLGINPDDFVGTKGIPTSSDRVNFDNIPRVKEMVSPEKISALMSENRAELAATAGEYKDVAPDARAKLRDISRLTNGLSMVRESLSDDITPVVYDSFNKDPALEANKQHLYEASVKPERFMVADTDERTVILNRDEATADINGRYSSLPAGGLTNLGVEHLVGKPSDEMLTKLKSNPAGDEILSAVNIRAKGGDSTTTVYGVLDKNDRVWVRAIEMGDDGAARSVNKDALAGIGIDSNTLQRGYKIGDSYPNEKLHQINKFNKQLAPSALREKISAAQINNYHESLGLPISHGLSKDVLAVEPLNANELSLLADPSARLADGKNSNIVGAAMTAKMVKATFDETYNLRPLGADEIKDFNTYKPNHDNSIKSSDMIANREVLAAFVLENNMSNLKNPSIDAQGLASQETSLLVQEIIQYHDDFREDVVVYTQLNLDTAEKEAYNSLPVNYNLQKAVNNDESAPTHPKYGVPVMTAAAVVDSVANSKAAQRDFSKGNAQFTQDFGNDSNAHAYIENSKQQLEVAPTNDVAAAPELVSARKNKM